MVLFAFGVIRNYNPLKIVRGVKYDQKQSVEKKKRTPSEAQNA